MVYGTKHVSYSLWNHKLRYILYFHYIFKFSINGIAYFKKVNPAVIKVITKPTVNLDVILTPNTCKPKLSSRKATYL